MRTIHLVPLALLAIVCLSPSHSQNASPTNAQAAADAEGFITIFDGKTLQGWEEMPAGKEKAWTVVDGVIHGDGDKGRGYLVYEKKQLADFELKFSYRFPKAKGGCGCCRY